MAGEDVVDELLAPAVYPAEALILRDERGQVPRTGRILYALNAAEGSISAFEVGRHGDLEPIGTASGLPAGAVTGLAAR